MHNSVILIAILRFRGARTTAMVDFIAVFFSPVSQGNGLPSITHKIEHDALHKYFSHAFVMSVPIISG
jgi:hypothetical protein